MFGVLLMLLRFRYVLREDSFVSIKWFYNIVKVYCVVMMKKSIWDVYYVIF